MNRMEIIAKAFEDELVKIASKHEAAKKLVSTRDLLFAGGGAVGLHSLAKAHRRYRIGREVEKQQGQQGY